MFRFVQKYYNKIGEIDKDLMLEKFLMQEFIDCYQIME